MSFTRNWVEELVSEWMHIEGYLLETNIPISTPERGGRREVDIAGAKLKDDKIKILHIEVGTLFYSTKEAEERLKKKFTETNKKSLLKFFRKMLGEDKEFSYECMYITSCCTKKTKNLFQDNPDIIPYPFTFKMLEEFIKEDVFATIEHWCANPPHAPRTSGGIVLPESHWLLKLLEFLKLHKMV